MKRALFGLAAFVAGVALMTSPAVSQPPDGKGGKGTGKEGKGGGMRAGFKLGTILPPFMVEELKLTDEQKTQLADLEKDVKTKLDKLLTDEQKKALENTRPGGGFPGGQGGDKGGKGGGKGGDKGGKGGKGDL
ncbi:hypothetical protein R5W24_005341 [Gemmata sp. JC717]|uniref:Uncharacterized protein n=1 Tax=Gemmata algarum TaxID=2975278 RepID=A0ABU5F663_9BACT|nr:hypothetical protein [Gemmata algarum]MDY3556178.1 hypothetical protein [Gemmata algarum]MDY3563065.1 hypothetical protein [Gemmata algarum]